MKAGVLTCLALVFSSLLATAQSDSPYARFGYEGKVLRTPQERQQRMMLLVTNTDTTSAVAQLGLDPTNKRYYLFDSQNQIVKIDTLAATNTAHFLSVDPLAPRYAFYSPYIFAGNTPIQALDLDGLEILGYKSNFTMNFAKTIIGVTYFGQANKGLEYFTKNKVPFNDIRVANQSHGIIYKDEPGSSMSSAPSIWNDDRPDASSADKTADKFEEVNNLKVGKSGFIAEVIQRAAIYAYGKINEEKNLAYDELSQQSNALKKAFELVDNSIASTRPDDMTHNYAFFNVSSEQYRTDLTNYVFDGGVPKSTNKNYSKFISSQGKRILDNSRTEKNQKRKSN